MNRTETLISSLPTQQDRIMATTLVNSFSKKSYLAYIEETAEPFSPYLDYWSGTERIITPIDEKLYELVAAIGFAAYWHLIKNDQHDLAYEIGVGSGMKTQNTVAIDVVEKAFLPGKLAKIMKDGIIFEKVNEAFDKRGSVDIINKAFPEGELGRIMKEGICPP